MEDFSKAEGGVYFIFIPQANGEVSQTEIWSWQEAIV